MFIGELELGKLEYDNIAFQILLMIFVLICIVLMNLFNALAISDIGKILADGKIIGIQKEIYNIHKMERTRLFWDKLGCFLKNSKRDVYLFKNDFKKSKVVSYPEDFWPKSLDNLYSKLPLGETLYKKWMEWITNGKYLLEESKRLVLSAKRCKKKQMETSLEELMEKLEILEQKQNEDRKENRENVEKILEKLENLEQKQKEDREENRKKLEKILELLTELQHSK